MKAGGLFLHLQTGRSVDAQSFVVLRGAYHLNVYTSATASTGTSTRTLLVTSHSRG